MQENSQKFGIPGVVIFGKMHFLFKSEKEFLYEVICDRRAIFMDFMIMNCHFFQGVLDTGRTSEVDDEKREKLSPADLQFLKSGISFKNKFSLPTSTGSPRDNSEMFDESWPVTERPSSLRYLKTCA